MARATVNKKRRPKNSGGMRKKVGYYLDSGSGEKLPYTFYQASREVPLEKLPKGITRKRITGNGATPSHAKEAFNHLIGE